MFSFGVIVIGVTLLLALKLWLDYCLKIDERHKDDPVHARTLIAATGRSFPLRSRCATGASATSLFGRDGVDSRSSIRRGRSE